MRKNKIVFVGLIGAFLLSCGHKSSSSSTSDNSNNSNPPDSQAVDAASPKFQFVIQNTADVFADTTTNNTALPAAGSPTINTGGAVTTFTTAAQTFNPTTFYNPSSATGSYTENLTPATSLTGDARSATFLVTKDAVECSSTLSPMMCAVDGSNTKQLDVSAIPYSSLTASTTSLPLTVDGTALAAPTQLYTVAYAGCNQCSTNDVIHAVGMAETADFVFVNSLYTESGQSYNQLFQIKKSDNTTTIVFAPFHGTITEMASFGGSIYMSAKTNTDTYSQFIKYDPTANTFTNLSGSGSTLGNPRTFTMFNSKLYFVAQDASGFERLFTLSAGDALARVFNMCPSHSDGAFKLTVTSLGLYTEVVDPNSCGTTYDIVRLNASGSVVPLYYDTISGSTALVGGVVVSGSGSTAVFSETNHNGAYRDNGDGTVSVIFDKSASSVPELVAGAGIGTDIYYRDNSNNIAKITSTGAVNKLPIPNISNGAQETILFNGTFFFTGLNASNHKKLFKLDASDNLINVKIRSLSLDDTPQFLTIFDNDLYFAANNSSGFQKLFKLTADGTLYQVSDFSSGGADQITGIYALTSGLYLNINDVKVVLVKKN